MKFLNMFKKKHFFTCRMMDLKKADEFYHNNKDNIRNMWLTLESDATGSEIKETIVEDGVLIRNPVTLYSIEGVKETCFAVPCIVVEYNSGTVVVMACYSYYEYDFDNKNVHIPYTTMYNPVLPRRFYPYNESEREECSNAWDYWKKINNINVECSA